MGTEDRRFVIGGESERPHPGLLGHLGKRVEHRVPAGFVNLQRTMEHVARKESLFRARSEAD